MSSLIEEFLEGSKRVTAKIWYFIPLHEGENPRPVSTKIIGEQPVLLHHSGILQEFVYQQDDCADVSDSFKDVFAKVMSLSGGIVKIHDRSQRIVMMQEEAQLEAQKKLTNGITLETVSGITVPQILIPKPNEETNKGMEEINRAFRVLVPFPRLRSLLQHWQSNVSGPLHHVQFAPGNMTSGIENHHVIN